MFTPIVFFAKQSNPWKIYSLFFDEDEALLGRISQQNLGIGCEACEPEDRARIGFVNQASFSEAYMGRARSLPIPTFFNVSGRFFCALSRD